jgi:hypothetical protein
VPVRATCYCGHCEKCWSRARTQRYRARKRQAHGGPVQRACRRRKPEPCPLLGGVPGPEDMEQLLIGPDWHDCFD